MSDDLVRYDHDGPAAVLTLNRPDRRNALSRELIAALDAAVARAEIDRSVRVLMLTGEGSAFCAGMDLAELRETISASVDANIIWDDAHRLAALYHRLYTLPKPTIALVNGAAVAGGAGLVTVCDLAVAVESAVFGYPEVRRGLVAAMVMPHLLRHVGERTARHLLLTGELIAAPEAVRCDLINECVSADRLSARGRELAASLAEGGPQALATTKALLQRVAPSALSLEEAARGSAEPRLTDECREGLTAFFEKRTVSWSPGVTSS